ncbi:hypothetical protein [Azotobacter vinelandii]|uniref:hypothetical protein n=1 Tax=Azotobacter vinelandii TaxID=354 RepID=UPI002665F79C|nr:hypothetical protein [Azotobacter vinelandii]WKN21109.1 hypothetical protein AVAEIV_004172 [Azotobacter vinelandii]
MNTVQPRFSSDLLRSFWQLNRCLLGALVLALSFTSPLVHAQETNFRHQYLMRGQILEVEDKTLVICVGSADGAEVGQELDVVRHQSTLQHKHKEPGPPFRRENIGRVKITTIFDEHYAEAIVIDGDVRVNDTVEIRRD